MATVLPEGEASGMKIAAKPDLKSAVLMVLLVTAVAAAAGAARAFAAGGYAGLSPEQARVQAVKRLHTADPKTSLLVATASQSFDARSGRNAWDIAFRARSGFGDRYSGCDVYVWRGGGQVGTHCRGWRH
jgi:hypothetical protein